MGRHELYLSVVLGAFCAGAAAGAPFTVPINTAQSNVSVQLCISGSCGSDTSPASGYMTIDVDDVDTLGTITAYDFRIALTEPLNIVVSFGILGRLTVNMNNFAVFGATPGVAVGPVPISGGSFSIPGIPSLQSGTYDYLATGIVCTLLQGQSPPIPCSGNADLSQQPQGTTTLAGTISSPSRVVTIVSTLNESGPIDPTNPGLGTLTITGTIRGSLLVPVPPCPGDVNGDGAVNTADLAVLLGNFGQSVPPNTGGDLTGNGVVNTADLAQLLGVFGTICADH